MLNDLRDSAERWLIPFPFIQPVSNLTIFLKKIAGFTFKAAKTIVYITHSEIIKL